MGNIPAGQAVVTDASLPGQSFKYEGLHVPFGCSHHRQKVDSLAQHI
jgi:hypothetical protein